MFASPTMFHYMLSSVSSQAMTSSFLSRQEEKKNQARPAPVYICRNQQRKRAKVPSLCWRCPPPVHDVRPSVAARNWSWLLFAHQTERKKKSIHFFHLTTHNLSSIPLTNSGNKHASPVTWPRTATPPPAFVSSYRRGSENRITRSSAL